MKSVFLSLLKKLTPNVIFPFYHAVTDHPAQHYKNLFDARSIDCFSQDLDTFKNFGDPIGLKQLLTMTEENYFPGRFFMISFDDGLSEVYDFAVPEMEKKEVKATLFINSDFVSNADLFYRYKASLILETPVSDPIKIYSFFDENDKNTSIRELLLNIKYHEKKILDQIAEAINLDFHQYLQTSKVYMTGKQIMELHQMGYDIGGHSVDHPLFHDIDPEEQLLQARQSLDFVETLTGTDIRAFAFPFSDWGVKDEFFKKCDADLTFGTAKIKQDPIKNHFQRLSFEENGKSGSQILNREFSAYLVKRLIGKHRTKRR
ncbi:MAG: polysaccharide deacetylase family protein [Saprospirales bacterium]|nr:MAG: polysaccharide deacetylase family protein [Saprospirales bacterium]